MAGGGGDVVSPRAQHHRGDRRLRRRQQEAACLPLDVIVEIATRSDAATLVRCAATCRAARRRIAEEANLPGRLRRLRDTGRFLLPLLRGYLTTHENGRLKSTVHLVDTSRPAEVTFATAAAEAEKVTDPVLVDSRGGLVLIRASATATAAAPPLLQHWLPQLPWHDLQQHRLLVCNPATGRHVALPPEPAFPKMGCDPEQYVLLVGDRDDDGEGDAVAGAGNAVGRPFQVLKAKLQLCPEKPSYRLLLVQTFSSEHGAWSPRTEIPIPKIHGGYACWTSLQKAMVVGDDVVHWMCVTDVKIYVLMLHVISGTVNVTALPASLPRHGGDRRRYLLATDSPGGKPVVLVADKDKISAWDWDWEQSKHTNKAWKPRPRAVIENETMLRFKGVAELVGKERTTTCVPELLWFGERSGVVLLQIHGCCLL